jgi:HAD superfamily hydrolase (TIGR01662 family)
MLVGPNASGKGSLVQKCFPEYVHLNRDKEGGKVIDLIPKMVAAVLAGKNVVLDNTYPTVESRAPFIEQAKRLSVLIRCCLLDTSIEQSQINALLRMWNKYGEIFFDAEALKKVAGDPNMFPPAALFRYRKEYQKPTLAEGFESLEKIKFERQWGKSFVNKAVILDYDDTLRRTVGGNGKYPLKPEEIEILPNRKKVLGDYKKKGYLLLGASNQSAVGGGELTYQDAVRCFDHTNKLLGLDIEYKFCPHKIIPAKGVQCYCRKPQSGIGVYFICKHQLNPAECIFVGDQTSDKSFAERLGFQFAYPQDFFA